MICRDIKCFKVVIIILDLGSLNHFITHTDKDILDLIKSYRIGMTMTCGNLFGGQGHIDSLGGKLKFHLLCLETRLCLIKLCLDGLTGLIYHLTYLGSLLGGDILHAL